MAMIRVHVHPGARRSIVQGLREDGALKLAVDAPPEDGRANRAVEALLADTLDVARRAVSVVRGHGSRSKWIEIEGMSEDEIRRRLDIALAGEGKHGG
jgi:uncharacterized protein